LIFDFPRASEHTSQANIRIQGVLLQDNGYEKGGVGEKEGVDWWWTGYST
jgi:hypothetical protein